MMQLMPFEILDWVNPEKIKLDNYRDDLIIQQVIS